MAERGPDRAADLVDLVALSDFTDHSDLDQAQLDELRGTVLGRALLRALHESGEVTGYARFLNDTARDRTGVIRKAGLDTG